MRTEANMEEHPEMYVRDEVRPMWYFAFWGIWIFDLVMLALVFVVPAFVAIWITLLVGATVIGGFSYKANKFEQPLPDDERHKPHDHIEE